VQKNTQSYGGTGPCIEGEGEGERFAPGEPVASAPPISVDTFGEQEELVLNFSGNGPSLERIQKVVDLHMSHKYDSSWRSQVSGSKAILFVLDASGSMAGSRLCICKKSIKNILENFISDDDHVGLIAFASHTEVMFEMMTKKGNLRLMLERLQELEVFGQTNFYDAMLEGVQKLSEIVSNNRWIIALTDGEDTGSTVDLDGSTASSMIKELKLNLACITVGKLNARFMKIIQNYIDNSKNGMHVEASNTQKIADAFKQVAHLIDGGLNECL